MQIKDIEHDAGLLPFITAAKAAGTADTFVLDLLKASGWSERRIFAAFGEYYTAVLGCPVPVRGTRLEYARDGFLYLLAFIALGCWATGVGHLFYILIDGWFPSTLDSSYVIDSVRQNVSFELATIIVAFPIWFIVNRNIGRQLAARPESADSGVRKWLTYVALVIASVILLADAIAFLQSFLHGDLTQRFTCDTLVLFAIVGTIFGHYWQSLRAGAVAPMRDRLFAGISIAAVTAALVCGFSNSGLPAHQRDLSLDAQRVANLSVIARRIAADRQAISDLSARPAVLDEFHDPVTHRPYEFERVDRRTYRLCATFARASANEGPAEFGHAAGRTCFTLANQAIIPLRTDPEFRRN